MGAGRSLLGPLEGWAEERITQAVEPRIQRWLDRWAQSASGRRLLAAALADVAADAVGTGLEGTGTLVQDVLVGVVARVGRDEAVRRRLLEALGAGDTPVDRGR